MSDSAFPRVDRGPEVADEARRFGVFDTLLVEDGLAWFVERHLARLQAACAHFDIEPFAHFDVARELAQFVARLERRTALVKTSIHGGSRPSLSIRARAPRVVPLEGVELLPVGVEPDPLGPWKTTVRATRVLHGDQAEVAGAFDALFVLEDGEVVETARANVFAVVDGLVTTPPLAAGVLPGIVRGLLVESIPGIVERRLDVGDLRRAREVWISSSGLRCAPVRSIRGLCDALPAAAGPGLIAARAALAEREFAYRANTSGR